MCIYLNVHRGGESGRETDIEGERERDHNKEEYRRAALSPTCFDARSLEAAEAVASASVVVVARIRPKLPKEGSEPDGEVLGCLMRVADWGLFALLGFVSLGCRDFRVLKLSVQRCTRQS